MLACDFSGLRLLITNWRLMLVQALPAMWIWAVTVDLKAHVLRGRAFDFIHGPIVLVLFAAVTGWGTGIGLALAVAITLAPRWGLGWFALLLGIVLAAMMLCYVAVPGPGRCRSGDACSRPPLCHICQTLPVQSGNLTRWRYIPHRAQRTRLGLRRCISSSRR